MGLRLGLRGWRRGPATASFGLLLSPALIALVIGSTTYAHDVTTHVTWNREISRIVFTRCAPCHHPGGSAFSLMSYAEANPWVNAIKEQVLRRYLAGLPYLKRWHEFEKNHRSFAPLALPVLHEIRASA